MSTERFYIGSNPGNISCAKNFGNKLFFNQLERVKKADEVIKRRDLFALIKKIEEFQLKRNILFGGRSTDTSRHDRFFGQPTGTTQDNDKARIALCTSKHANYAFAYSKH